MHESIAVFNQALKTKSEMYICFRVPTTHDTLLKISSRLLYLWIPAISSHSDPVVYFRFSMLSKSLHSILVVSTTGCHSLNIIDVLSFHSPPLHRDTDLLNVQGNSTDSVHHPPAGFTATPPASGLRGFCPDEDVYIKCNLQSLSQLLISANTAIHFLLISPYWTKETWRLNW